MMTLVMIGGAGAVLKTVGNCHWVRVVSSGEYFSHSASLRSGSWTVSRSDGVRLSPTHASSRVT